MELRLLRLRFLGRRFLRRFLCFFVCGLRLAVFLVFGNQLLLNQRISKVAMSMTALSAWSLI